MRRPDLRGNLSWLLLITVALRTEARFVVERGGLRIKFPTDAAAEHPDGFDMSLGNFGSPLYGGTLTGKLVYVDSEHGHAVSCSPECRYACQAFNASSPPFSLDPAEQYIMLVDRGPTNSYTPACKFTEKVWNAQNAGAVAVLVVNYEESHTTMDAPDEEDEDKNFRYLTQLTIPAAFLPKSTGDVLKELTKQNDAYVVMDWSDVLPRESKVRWQFWSGSNDMCGAKCDVQKEFIKQFVPAAKQLEQGNWTSFQPHYLTHLCPEVYIGTHECATQCIHKGRYCAPDPDGSIEEGYSGGEVVQENLRQLCVFKLGAEAGRPWVWWEYVTRFADECAMAASRYTRECAEAVFKEVGGEEWSNLAAFRGCAGGADEDRENELLEMELRSQRGGGDVGEVYILPTIRINDGQYRGRLAYSDVLRAICSGFRRGTEPSACMHASSACYAGSPADTACKSNTDGRVQCQNTMSGYACSCGRCYNEVKGKDGQVTCKAKCKLSTCDAETGVCSTSLSGASIFGIIALAAVGLAAVGVGGYAAYRWRLRQEMRDEVKSILKQYMPLAESDDKAELRPTSSAVENA